jgi:hypothetical protein
MEVRHLLNQDDQDHEKQKEEEEEMLSYESMVAFLGHLGFLPQKELDPQD